MHQFHAEDTIEYPGQGTAYAIKDVDGLDPQGLIGQEVEIDGTVYTVLRVAVDIYNKDDKYFGLLVTRDHNI